MTLVAYPIDVIVYMFLCLQYYMFGFSLINNDIPALNY